MKILSPVNSYFSAQAQIESGADEIYVGMKLDLFKNYSLTGRGQTSKKYKSIVPDKEELQRIVNLAHDNNVEVSFVANSSCFMESVYDDINMEDIYIQYVEQGINAGVDNIIVGDIGLLYRLSEMNLPIEIHASTFFDTMSVDQLHMLKELGVCRSILTYQISIEEIKKLCEAKLMEIEVFGFLSCSFFNGSCNLVHEMGEVAYQENVVIGIPCKAEYKVFGSNIKPQITSIFDAELGCALCSLYKLNKVGVDVIKIAGRDRDYKMIAKVTSLFSDSLELIKNLNEEEYKEELMKIIYPWWRRLWCRKKRCKYMSNKITDSYIGLREKGVLV